MAHNKLVRRIAGLAAMLGLLAAAPGVEAQRRWEPLTQIEVGTTIQVRTTQAIRSSAVDGRVYNAIVDNDVLDDEGRLAIQAGSTAELIVRQIGGEEMEIDLDSITVGGRRYAVRADSTVVGT